MKEKYEVPNIDQMMKELNAAYRAKDWAMMFNIMKLEMIDEIHSLAQQEEQSQ